MVAMILAVTEVTRKVSLSFIIICAILSVVCFFLQWLVIRYYETHPYKNTLWFFIKRHFFLLCGCMFVVTFVGALVSFINISRLLA